MGMADLLKFNAHGQWTLVKHRVLAPMQGGVPADFARPEVGPRAHQGKMQAVADDSGSPRPKEIRMDHPTDKTTATVPQGIPSDRGGQNQKRFGPNGESLKPLIKD